MVSVSSDTSLACASACLPSSKSPNKVIRRVNPCECFIFKRLDTLYMARYKFEALLERPQGAGTWTYLALPLDQEKALGTSSRVPVQGTIDGVRFRSSLLPNGAGGHFMVVKKEIRDMIGKSAGFRVMVSMELDSAPREVIIPEVVLRALRGNKDANARFKSMSYSHKKAYIEWVEGAKRDQTREKRAEKVVRMLLGSRIQK